MRGETLNGALVGDATIKLRCEPCGRTVVLGRSEAGRMFGLGISIVSPEPRDALDSRR